MDVINIAANHQMFTTLPANQVDSTWDDQPLTFTQTKHEKIAFWATILMDLRVTYALHLWLVGKPVVDFIFVVIELFSLSPTVETLWAEIGRSRRFSKGVGHFEHRCQSEGGCWCQKTRVIAVSCGIKISAVLHLVLSQYTHLTDRWTDRRTDRWTDRIATAIPCVALHAVAQ